MGCKVIEDLFYGGLFDWILRYFQLLFKLFKFAKEFANWYLGIQPKPVEGLKMFNNFIWTKFLINKIHDFDSL